MASVDTAELVERIWARDATVWTGRDESRWLGWLDEPLRMQERVPQFEAFAREARADFAHFLLLGMGGSSLAPEVFRRASRAKDFHVLDTTHPVAVRRLAEQLDVGRTLFIVASKSGTTLETRCHLDFFWRRAHEHGEQFVAITDPGSELEALAEERGFRAVFHGEPTIGGRYSALSAFGILPAALMNIPVGHLLERAASRVFAAHGPESEALELGLSLGSAWEEGRDKVVINPNPAGFGLWVEQLLAESTGKQGKGLIPAPGESPRGDDRHAVAPLFDLPADLGQDFYDFEFATAVAGSILGINPFDQPNVQEAKDRTTKVLSGHDPGSDPGTGSERTIDELLAGAAPPEYVCIQAFIDPAREAELEPLIRRARDTGCVVTHGLGPRYLHSTGQLHKGGPPTGRFIQVVDDPGPELDIPNRDFGFARLIQAQAAGDFAALKQRGRPIIRIKLEDV